LVHNRSISSPQHTSVPSPINLLRKQRHPSIRNRDDILQFLQSLLIVIEKISVYTPLEMRGCVVVALEGFCVVLSLLEK